MSTEEEFRGACHGGKVDHSGAHYEMLSVLFDRTRVLRFFESSS